MSTTASTSELVHRFLPLLGAGDPRGAAALFADDVDFDIPHEPVVWWVPPVSTREELAGFLVGLAEELETLRFDVERVLVDGDDAVVLGVIEDRVRRTGRSFTSRFALRLTARDGRLVRYHFLEDSAAAARAAG